MRTEALLGDPFSQASKSRLSPEMLYLKERDALLRLLTLVTGDRELAEDCVQEAFARLCLNWRSISAYEHPELWVRRVALNRAKDERRSLARRARLILRLRPSPQAARAAPEGDERLWQAVGELPIKQRTALALYYLDDLKVSEIAEAMGVSSGTVKRHLERARTSLGEKLEATHEV